MVKYFLAGLLAATVATVYVLTSSWCVYPNQYAMLVGQRAGLAPLFFLIYPLWGSAVSIISSIFPAHIGGAVAAMSVVAGTLAAALFCLSVWEWIALLLDEYADYSEGLKKLVCAVASCASTLAFSFSVPAWVVSNRSHPAMLGVVLLLAGFLLLLRYARREKALYGYVAIGCFFVAALENINLGLTMLVTIPILLFLAWKAGHISWRSVASVVALGAATGVVALLIAWQYSGTDAATFRELDGTWMVLKNMVIERLTMFRVSCLSRGWLLVFCISILPWVVCVFNTRNIWTSPRDPSTVVMMLTVLICCVSVAWNVRISPYVLIGRSSIPVAPYILSSMSLAYAVAYFLSLCFGSEREGALRLRSKFLAFCLITAFITGSIYVAVKNFAYSDARSGSVATRCAQALISDLDHMMPDGSRTVVFSDGSLDAQIILAAKEVDRDILLVSPVALEQDHYRRHFESRLQSMSQRFASRLGSSALFTELASSPTADTIIAIQRPAGLWDLAGKVAVPRSFFYAGIDRPAAGELTQAVSNIAEMWDELKRDVPDDVEDVNSYGDSVGYSIRNWLSAAANNAGVALEDLGMVPDAVEAYQLSLLISEGNISAAMNLLTVIQKGDATGNPDDLRERIKDFVSKQTNRAVLPLVLESRFGKVRSPLSMLWQAGLMRKMGLHDLAMQKQADAAAMTGQAIPSAGASSSDEMLERLKADIEKDPRNGKVVYGLIRYYISVEDAVSARNWLASSADKGVVIPHADMLEAGLLQLEGDLSGAKLLLQRMVSADPSRADAWGLLVQVLSSLGNKESLGEAIPILRRSLRSSWVLPMAEAQLAALEGDYSRARNRFVSVMVITGVNPSILEELIRLSFRLSDSISVKKYAKQLIGVDPDNASAYHALGVIFLQDADLDMAEYCILRALLTKRAANILNDAAWLRYLQGDLADGEKLVRESLDVDGQASQSWDTLGVILMHKGAFAESEAALLKASELSGGSAGVSLHYAELLLKMNERARALAVLNELVENQEHLSAKDNDKIRAMLKVASGS